MSSTKTDPTIVLATGGFHTVAVVAFHPDGKHVLGGGKDGIRRWRLEDGQEVGKQTGMVLNAISVTRDQKWVVCGTDQPGGADVSDEEMQKKVIHVEGTSSVNAVDVSPDSTTFATGIDREVSVWRITSGKRLVGPLNHEFYVTAVRFSPNGERIATASSGRSMRVFDSRNGDELITIETVTPEAWPITPLAWSNDSQQIFAACNDKIKLFDVSTGSQLAESQTPGGSDVYSLALAANGKFIATSSGRTISFLDTSTLSQIDPVIKDSQEIWTIAISPNSGYLAAGRKDGKITIRDLGGILPDVYGPFHTSNREERQLDERPSTSGGRDNKSSDSSLEEPGKSGPLRSPTHNEGGNEDLLEVEVSSSAPAPDFDFDEPSSPGSSAHCEDEAPPLDTSHAVAQLPDAIPATYPPLACAEEHVDIIESSQGITMFTKWLQAKTKKGNKNPTSHKPDRAPRRSRRHADRRPSSQSPARADATNEGPSRMAAGQRVRRAVAKPVVKADPKPPAKSSRHNHRNKNASRSGQGSANPKEGDPAQQANDTSQPSAEGVQLTRKSGKAILRFSIAFPGWMCCGSGTEDEIYSSG